MNLGNTVVVCLSLLSWLACCPHLAAQRLISDVAYVEGGHERQVLDIYTPEESAAEKLPVMFWIHGGGSQVGDKADVPARAYGKRDSNHSRLNNDLGKPDDPATEVFFEFLDKWTDQGK